MNALGIAERLGLHRVGRDWRGTCPACGYAEAFVMTERDGRRLGWCASCGPDGQQAIGRVLGGDAPPVEPAKPRRAETATAQRRAAAEALWRRAIPCAGTPAGRYLERRCLPAFAASPSLRFLADCPHPSGVRVPAMLAAVHAPAGGFLALHRTYLAPDGRKAAIEPVRATLARFAGGVVRLSGPELPAALAIGEGLETSAAAGELLGLPAWAAISAGNLARLALPAAVRDVVVAVDHDPAGVSAAREAAARWRQEGRRVRLARPHRVGTDLADVLAERRA